MSEGGERRGFLADGEEWVAWRSGAGAVGTGAWGLGRVEAVHFARPDSPGRPLREALIAKGRFDNLFEDELAELLRRATPIVGSNLRQP
jgi:hypothetical protein